MLKNTHINRLVIQKIANALGALNKEVVYVGGATVSLYINDPAAEDVRPTKDVGISLSIATVGELDKVRVELIKRGFNQSSKDKIICRFRYEDILVDVMNTKAVGWAPANPWFEPGFKHKKTIDIEGQKIQILSLDYFLASKFAAFNNRGANEPRTSHDFEDIIYIFDNCTDIVEQLVQAKEDVKPFLMEQLEEILNNRTKQEAIYGNLYYETQQGRYDIIMDNIKKITHWI